MALTKEERIKIMLGLDVVFFLVELVVGLAVGSLALMADAFHMLNDIISLLVGLWAVKAAQKSSTDKYSFGWLRAEILGAFFNAVFLIGLCLTIVLDAITRLLDPPTISNPIVILIVGSVGLVSNLFGFLVLGGHGHAHGAEEHDHGSEEHEHEHTDEVRAAEEGHSHTHDVRQDIAREHTDENGGLGHVFPEAVLARAKSTSHIRFQNSDRDGLRDKASPKQLLPKSTGGTPRDKASPKQSLPKSIGGTPKKHKRRTSGYFNNIDDLSIHPASFRQEIIAASRPQLDGTDSEDDNSDGYEAVMEEDGPTENSPLLGKSNGKSNGAINGHQHKHEHHKKRQNSLHAGHNHLNQKNSSSGGHGHSHDDMGMNAMILHVIGDALGNVGVIVAALIIWLAPWSWRFYADPIVSLFITVIILNTTFPLTKATAKILLQATPDHIPTQDVKKDIEKLDGVVSCHHIHIWQLSDTQIVASMHIQCAFPISEASGSKYMDLARTARECLHEWGIHSATIQPEFCLDEDHDHVQGSTMGLDGIVGQTRCKMDDDECLLECVDDCKKGCCSTPTSENHDHSDHDRHSH